MPPKFPKTPKTLNSIEAMKAFNDSISKYVLKSFKSNEISEFDKKGKHQIFINFKVDTLGFIKNIKISSKIKYHDFQFYACEKMKLIPKLIPAKHKGNNIAVIYSLPISINVK